METHLLFLNNLGLSIIGVGCSGIVGIGGSTMNGLITASKEKQSYDPEYTFEELIELSKECSTKERIAEKAEREALTHLKCAFASEHIGETFDGQIVGVTNFGLFIPKSSLL